MVATSCGTQFYSKEAYDKKSRDLSRTLEPVTEC